MSKNITELSDCHLNKLQSHYTHFRSVHIIDSLADLPTAKLSTTEPAVSTTSTTLTCGCENCEDQIAVCYCIDCDLRFCYNHQQVSVRYLCDIKN